MKVIILAYIAAVGATASPPWTINNNGTISCRKIGSFCAGDSDKTNIIIHCTSKKSTAGNYAGNCNDNLAGVCGGVCEFAPCRQTCPKTGDAYCSVDGAIAANGTTLHDPSGESAKSDTKIPLLPRVFDS